MGLIQQIHSKLPKKCVKLQDKTYFMKPSQNRNFFSLKYYSELRSSDQSCLFLLYQGTLNSAYKCHQLQYWLSGSKATTKNA